MLNPALVVADVNELVERYGLNVVQHTLDFIAQFPINLPSPIVITDYEGHKTVVTLTAAQFTELKRQYGDGPSYNKIQAIKWLRELTSLGLKEAKDAVDMLHPQLIS